MDKEFYDKYGKLLKCADCSYLERCIKDCDDTPMLTRCQHALYEDKITDLEAELAESKQEANDWKQRFESSEERNKQMTDNSVKSLELKNEKIKQLTQALA